MISSDHLEPGSTGKIKVEVNTAGRSGHLDKYVSIFSNDRRHPVLTLMLGLDVLKAPAGDAPPSPR